MTVSGPTASERERAAPRLEGLTADEVEESRRLHGQNVLTPAQRTPGWKLYLEKFNDPVIRILVIAAAIAIVAGAARGEYTEGVGIIVAILLATALAFFHERKAFRAFDILNRVGDEAPVQVIRGARYTAIPLRDVVVGDIVLVEAGAEVPADGVLVEAVSLTIDQSKLTGEPPVVKRAATGDGADDDGADEQTYPRNVVLRSTIVVDGQGVLRVSAVGDETEIGKTARAVVEHIHEKTPLDRQLARLAAGIGFFGFAIAVITFAALTIRGMAEGKLPLSTGQWAFGATLGCGLTVGLARVWLPIIYDGLTLVRPTIRRPAWLTTGSFAGSIGPPALGLALAATGVVVLALAGAIAWSPSQWLPVTAAATLLRYFMVAVTLVVVAVPEGLAMSVTLSLAFGMRKMTASNNLVRRMQACETIGAATVICSDKTGTLTLSEMRAQEVVVPGLGGGGLAAKANCLAGRLLAEGIAANSTANVAHEDGKGPTGLGNPTEVALLLWLSKNGVDYVPCRDAFLEPRRLTFTTERKFMATLGRSPVTEGWALHVKGAPEILLARTRSLLGINEVEAIDAHRASIEAAVAGFQGRGMRTLGFAYREVPAADVSGSPGDAATLDRLAHELTWLGFAAIADPIRPDAAASIRACQAAGIRVKIVTGDSALTAREIGRQVGLIADGDAAEVEIDGRAWAKLDDAAAAARAGKIRIMSRARPMDKMRLVKVLQRSGHVVAVTGDGTNDAAALHCADVGLSMGKTGTAVAREASDIVLLDDSFGSIVTAVLWGRSLYLNIQRFVLFQLTINVAALLVALLGPFVGVRIPLTVIQMLWINLIMDTLAAVALASEPPDPAVLRRPPRHRDEFIITPAMAKQITFVGGMFVVISMSFLRWIEVTPAPAGSEIIFGHPNVTRYELSLFYTMFVMLQFWNLFNARRLGSTESALVGLGRNPLFLGVVVTILVVQVLVTQFGGDVFTTRPLSGADWLLIIVATSAVLWVGEVTRFLGRRARIAGRAH